MHSDSSIIGHNFDNQEAITTLLDEEIPGVLKKLKQYLTDGAIDDNLVHNIMEFCHEYCYSLDLIADVIKTDPKLKITLHNYCTQNKIFQIS